MRAASLPHGVATEDGGWRRDALLRGPTGADELLLADLLAGECAAVRVSALLERCVEGVDVRALVAGDREALLLQLRRLSFGDRLACVVTCGACEERMDVLLSVGELLVAPYEDVAAVHEADGVRFRLPTGADLEAAGRAPDDDAGAALLLERCVLDGDGNRDAVAAAMGQLDPQAEVRLAADCPACGAPVDALLDAGALVLDELGEDPLREVHALARHYHWSEGEILALEVPRRRRYLELLVDDATPEGVVL